MIGTDIYSLQDAVSLLIQVILLSLICSNASSDGYHTLDLLFSPPWYGRLRSKVASQNAQIKKFVCCTTTSR